MLSSHTLATSIISRHNTPAAVLDADELAMLKTFCQNPAANKDSVLAQYGMQDDEGQRPGTKAMATKGSLVGVLIARYGGSEPTLTEGEVGELRRWFESGGSGGREMMEEDME